MAGPTIRNYPRNGVFLSQVDHYRIGFGRYANNTECNIFPIFCTAGSIVGNDVSGNQCSDNRFQRDFPTPLP